MYIEIESEQQRAQQANEASEAREKQRCTPLQQATARLKAQNDQLEAYLKGNR